MKTFLFNIFGTILHLSCCILPISSLGVSFLSFRQIPDQFAKYLLITQGGLTAYLIIGLVKKFRRKIIWKENLANKIYFISSITSIGLFGICLYVNIKQPFHSEEQKLMQQRLERIRKHQNLMLPTNN